jgi:hypothetical protein
MQLTNREHVFVILQSWFQTVCLYGLRQKLKNRTCRKKVAVTPVVERRQVINA